MPWRCVVKSMQIGVVDQVDDDLTQRAGVTVHRDSRQNLLNDAVRLLLKTGFRVSTIGYHPLQSKSALFAGLIGRNLAEVL
jgi:hypothetical protein